MAILTKEELQNQDVPNDLKLAIQNFECIEDLFEEMECRFFDPEEIPSLTDNSYLTDSDKKNKGTMAAVSASDQVFEHITFVVEALNGDLVGYWHGPENVEIKKAPIVKYDTEGQFSILSGLNLIEALVGDYVFDEDDEFLEFQENFSECGIEIVSKWDDLVETQPKTNPDKLHDSLYHKFLKENA
ncbi:hypothetical protein MNBD_BACTEROID03-2272 [hydrothermal vent metagenome]|uniref:Uncharacterized protein n=1 Tax=hydrothermal vent metagenome TaxID=652676 RepID=A0A3B0T0U5_9ZZZZ